MELLLSNNSPATYIVLFVLFFIFGRFASVPVMFMAFAGLFPFWSAVALGIVAFTVNDHAWYYIGRRYAEKNFFPAPVRENAFFKKIHAAAQKNIKSALVVTKFMFGAPIPTAVYAGKTLLAPITFLFYSLLGTISYVNAIIIAIHYFQISSLSDLQTPAVLLRIAIGVVCIVSLQLLLQYYFFKKRV
jgi:membrane protein DedA with SNARE-associated domain